MDKALGIEEVLSNVAFDVNLVISHVAYLSHHIAAILLPSHVLGESDGNLPKDCV